MGIVIYSFNYFICLFWRYHIAQIYEYIVFLEPIKEIKDDETQCHSYLYKHGWRIDEDLGVAFGFDIEDLRKEGYTIN